VERNFARLKGRPLSLAPLYVQRDDHRGGLVRLLTIALRVITLWEGVVRQRLGEQHQELAGLFAGNPKRRTSQPTTERLLDAFREVTLTIVRTQGYALRHVTPLSPLQRENHLAGAIKIQYDDCWGDFPLFYASVMLVLVVA